MSDDPNDRVSVDNPSLQSFQLNEEKVTKYGQSELEVRINGS